MIPAGCIVLYRAFCGKRRLVCLRYTLRGGDAYAGMGSNTENRGLYGGAL